MAAGVTRLTKPTVSELTHSSLDCVISPMHHSTVRVHAGLSCLEWRHYPCIVRSCVRLAKLAACQWRKQRSAPSSLRSHYVVTFSCRCELRRTIRAGGPRSHGCLQDFETADVL